MRVIEENGRFILEPQTSDEEAALRSVSQAKWDVEIVPSQRQQAQMTASNQAEMRG